MAGTHGFVATTLRDAVVAATVLAGAWTVHAAPTGEPIQPIPQPARRDPARIELGRRLFEDVRLSANDSVSCASCHDVRKGGVDNRRFSIGFNGKPTDVNSPTVLNASLNFKQFWNGRADTLEAQIDHVIRSPIEMGSTWTSVIAKVGADSGYRLAFAASYSDGVSKANIQNAIASYERTLTTPNSRFDRFLRGDTTAISAAEKAGYAAFKRYGCVACHQGVNVGGNMFQKFGVMDDGFREAALSAADLGRFVVTRDERDRHVFKVPSLRNVAQTAPYFHDGSAPTLEAAVDVMFRVQLGRIPSRDDTQSIVRFLGTLSGERDTTP